MKGPVLSSDSRTQAVWLAVLVCLAVLTVLWPQLHPALNTLAAASNIGAMVVTPLNALRLQSGTSFLVPLLLGLMAVTAPCQLSTCQQARRDSRLKFARVLEGLKMTRTHLTSLNVHPLNTA